MSHPDTTDHEFDTEAAARRLATRDDLVGAIMRTYVTYTYEEES